MSKEAISQMPAGLPTHPHDLETLRSTNPAQAMFDNATFMATQFNQGIRLTVNKDGEARYEFVPKKTNVNPPNGTPVITIFEAFTKLPSSVESTNGQKKPKQEKRTRVNEALRAKNKRREQNEAIFSGIRGKNVYQNGQRVNVEAGPVNPENRTKNKRYSRGKRNGSR